MTALIVTGDRNVKAADWSVVFKPEAERFQKIHGGQIVQVDVSAPMSKRFAQVMSALSLIPDGSLETFAVFSHGAPRSVQVGVDLTTVRAFAQGLSAKARKDADLFVPLYCCSTASFFRSVFGRTATGGDGGFADALRDELCAAGAVRVHVFGHETVGHATHNPYVREFHGPVASAGGDWVVAPGSPNWKAWIRKLSTTDLRFRFPFLSREAIANELNQVL